ncbi:AAA family ATPase [Nocardioides sp.]|uniref:ATP-dependent nuclease n=1 Tax=Nocardioides sp. TaxID=35761 RepID=UPI0019B8F486|nr:AAA family ATPase [Nocardioides sp.]MBC7278677.1 AAA family ATPase [Nocardioides sp.]
MHLRKVTVEGFRASANSPVSVEFPGRFSVLAGSNGIGKTTINDAIYWAHLERFPRLQPPDASLLGPAPRTIDVEYAMEVDPVDEGALGTARQSMGLGAPSWRRNIERSLGQVRAAGIDSTVDGHDQLRLVYLPAARNPVDQLSRRETRVLLELMRAEQRRNPSGGSLAQVKAQAERMLKSLTTQQLLVDVQGRIAENLKDLTSGVQEHFAFLGTQRVDDAYLARVLELLLATTATTDDARRLEGASLGYVNLLHIAVTLAGIPDPAKPPAGPPPPAPGVPTADQAGAAAAETVSGQPAAHAAELGDEETAAVRRARLAEADERADEQQDSFWPDLFHATVLIEEPEAHLHPQLQHGLIRYLRASADERPDLQVIVSTHAGEMISACKPNDLVIVRRDTSGQVVSRVIANIPWEAATGRKVRRMAQLHLDASRSGALFADRVVLVEGITEVALLRAYGRAWACEDRAKRAFIDALAVVPIGNRIGEWPVRLLAEPGHELTRQVAVLCDTDKRPENPGDPLPAPQPPPWHDAFASSDHVQFFWSAPTLEPTLVPSNEELVKKALEACGKDLGSTPTATNVDDFFRKEKNKPFKGEFAFELAAQVEDNLATATGPPQLVELFDWLWHDHAPAPDGTAEGQEVAMEDAPIDVNHVADDLIDLL